MNNKLKRKKWSEEEIEILKENYESKLFKNWLFLLPNRTKTSIKLKANSLNLFRQTSGLDSIAGNVSKLLNEDCISYYWIGFLLADGHFSKENRLSLSLSIKDKSHMQALKEFLDFKLDISQGQTYCSIRIMDGFNIPKIKKKFDINNKKTYNPPGIDVFNRIKPNLLLSLLIGFIDGDGCIRKQFGRTDNALYIKNHSSWLNILILFRNLIKQLCLIEFPLPKITNQGYALLSCCNMNILKFLKEHAIQFKLPIMSRKWDKIDLNRISKYDKAEINKQQVIELRKQGLKYVEIAKIVGISIGRVSVILNNKNNE